MMYEKDLDKLIGLTILSLEVNKNKTYFRLNTDKGQMVLNTSADCCSESWAEHVTLPSLPAKILSIQEKDLGAAPASRQEYDQRYSTTIKTDKGDLEIEFRNSSNGYYGGELDLLENDDYMWPDYEKYAGEFTPLVESF